MQARRCGKGCAASPALGRVRFAQGRAPGAFYVCVRKVVFTILGGTFWTEFWILFSALFLALVESQ